MRKVLLNFKKIKFFLGHIYKSIKIRGFINTIAVLRLNIAFDLKNKTDTWFPVGLHCLKVVGKNKKYGVTYQGVDSFVFKSVFQKLNRDFTNSTFVDLGCGKGKALILASDFFQKLIGVDFSEEMCNICRKNIDKFSKRTGKTLEVEIINQDAAQYIIPENADVFFMYNSFHEPVISTVIDNIEKSLKINNREIFIIYVNALYDNIFEKRDYQLLLSLSEEASRYKVYDDYGVYVYTK